MKRLVEFDTEFAFHGTEPLETIANQEVTISGFSTAEGRYGLAAIMDVSLADGSTKRVRTSAVVPVRLLLKAQEQNAFPVVATFYKKGRYWNVR